MLYSRAHLSPMKTALSFLPKLNELQLNAFVFLAVLAGVGMLFCCNIGNAIM